MLKGTHMKIVAAFWLALALGIGAAHAQTANQVTPGYMSTTCPSGLGPCFVPTGGQAAIKGFGTLAVSSSSILVSTLTAGPNAAAWSTAQGMVYFYNAGAAALYLCPLGGTCATTTGIPIAVGATLAVFAPATTATVIGTTGTLVAIW